MPGRRVDIVDPTEEGRIIIAALREAGIEVVERTVSDLAHGTDAALVVLAGDAEGAAELLGNLRRAGATANTPVVLVGAPPGDETGADADAFYPRPVPLARFVRKVETFLGPAAAHIPSPSEEEPIPVRLVEPTIQLAGDDDSDVVWRPRERTMELPHEETPGSAVGVRATPNRPGSRARAATPRHRGAPPCRAQSRGLPLARPPLHAD